jgi:hypothetical protein
MPGPARALLGAGVFFVLLFTLGCSEPLPPLSPVRGKVTVDGNPVTSGNVSLAPEDTSKKAPPSSGQIGADGSYEIFTGGKAGAPLGKYKVFVTPPMVPGDPKAGMQTAFDKKYMDVLKSGLSFEVKDNAAAGAYDLKLTK